VKTPARTYAPALLFFLVMRYAALLRGVNVGGAKKVPMTDLRDLAANLGFGNPRTLLQSGNLVFDARAAASALEKKLEGATLDRFGFETKVVVRSADDWAGIVDRNPFATEAQRDPGRLIVLFLRTAPPKSAEQTLKKAIVGREVGRVIGREAYVYYPDGSGQSKLILPVIEKALGTPGTGRNWNTTLKIAHALMS
jgi:uncharacterized protein (DUF1697 family)